METEKILNRMSRSTLNIAVILALICCSGCVTIIGYDGPYHGRIVDKDTKKPIEGAVVAGDWGLVHFGPGGAHGTYYDTYETITDKNGDFTIPGQGIQIFSRLDQMQLCVLKAGYENIFDYWISLVRDYPDKDGKLLVIGLKKLTVEERTKRSIHIPIHAPNKKIKLLIRENNKEMIELGRPKNNILPEE